LNRPWSMDHAMHYQAKHDHDWCAWKIVLWFVAVRNFARLYGRFDERLGMPSKLFSGLKTTQTFTSNLHLKPSHFSPRNDPQLYHANFVFCACSSFTRLRYRLSYDLLELVPGAQKRSQATAPNSRNQKPARTTAEEKERLRALRP